MGSAADQATVVRICSSVSGASLKWMPTWWDSPSRRDQITDPPTSTSSVQVLGIAGTHSTWEGDGAVVSIRFVNGKVATKSYRKSEIKK